MKRRNRFEEIFLAISTPCLLLEPAADGFIITEANPGYLQLSGKTLDAILNRSLQEALPENSDRPGQLPQELLKTLRQVLQTGKKASVERLPQQVCRPHSRVAARRYWNYECIPLLDENKRSGLLLLIIEDVTQQVLEENKRKEELLLNRRQYLYFTQKHPDGLFTLNRKGELTSANPSLEHMMGEENGSLLGSRFLSFVLPTDRPQIQEILNKAIEGEARKEEVFFLPAKGIQKMFEISLVPMLEEGEVRGVYGIARETSPSPSAGKVLVEKRKFLKASAVFISTLFENDLQASELTQAFKAVGEAVEADRMYCFTTHTCETTGELLIRQRVEWASDRTVPQIHNPEMQDLSASRLEAVMKRLRQKKSFSATLDELEVGPLKNIFLDQDIKSMLLLPIFLKERLYGFIGFDDCTRQRIWNQEEVTFLQSLAQNFTTALEKNTAQEELRKQEETLKSSEQKFRALVQEGSDLLAILDLKGRYKFVSETTGSVLGLAPSEFTGRSVFEFIHAKDQIKVKRQFLKLKEIKQTKIGPFRLRRSDGKWGWFQTTATNLVKDPAVGGVVANTRDITTTVEQAREIEHLNERYRLAATATKDLMYDWDITDNRVTRFHKNLTDLLGYPVEEVEKEDFWKEHIHPEDYPVEMGRRNRALTNPGETFIRLDYRFRRGDGTYAKVIDRGFILRNDQGKAVRLVGAIRDISDLTAKEEALRTANKRFNTALEATNEMVWDWDIASDHVIRSKMFRKIFGYNIKEHTSMENFWLTKIIGKDRERVQHSLGAALQNPEQNRWKEEYRFLKADGEVTHIIDRGFIIRDNTGQPLRMVGAVLDVTESRRLIKKIKKQNKILREIAWEQSHVVRAPLARIKSLLKFMEMGIFDEMSEEEIWEQIVLSTEELDDVVRSIVQKTEEMDYEQPDLLQSE